MRLKGIIVGSAILLALIAVACIFIFNLYEEKELERLRMEYDDTLSVNHQILRESDTLKYLLTIVNEESYQRAKQNVKMNKQLYNMWFKEEEYTAVYRLSDIPTVKVKDKGYTYGDDDGNIRVYLCVDIIYVDSTESDVMVFATYNARGELIGFERKSF